MSEGTDLMSQLHGGRGSVSSSSSGGKGNMKGMPALMDVEADTAQHKEHLDKRYVQLCKTTKLAEKVRDQTLQVRLWSDRSNKALTQLTDTMEAAELLSMDVGFVLKFGKEKMARSWFLQSTLRTVQSVTIWLTGSWRTSRVCVCICRRLRRCLKCQSVTHVVQSRHSLCLLFVSYSCTYIV